MTDPVLTVRGLRRTFDADQAPVRALRGIDLTVRRGEFVGMIGPSGCGRSTPAEPRRRPGGDAA